MIKHYETPAHVRRRLAKLKRLQRVFSKASKIALIVTFVAIGVVFSRNDIGQLLQQKAEFILGFLGIFITITFLLWSVSEYLEIKKRFLRIELLNMADKDEV